jgi:hypothetical protein
MRRRKRTRGGDGTGMVVGEYARMRGRRGGQEMVSLRVFHIPIPHGAVLEFDGGPSGHTHMR